MAIVTFTTDYGVADGYVGALKGVVLSIAPDAVLVDITHQVPPQDVPTGAFLLSQAAPLFPAGTIHVGVVDPGVGGDRAEVVVASRGHVFVGPDNGLLALAAPPPVFAYRIVNPAFRREPVSATFHGRDVFAPAAGRLAAGAAVQEAGPRLDGLVPFMAGIEGASGGEARVVHVDRYGNIITSLPGRDLPGTPGATLRLELFPHRTSATLAVGRTFSDVAAGQLVTYVGSAGLVEIAVRNGSASEHLGAHRGQLLRLRTPS
jgi:hypothetical protein